MWQNWLLNVIQDTLLLRWILIRKTSYVIPARDDTAFGKPIEEEWGMSESKRTKVTKLGELRKILTYKSDPLSLFESYLCYFRVPTRLNLLEW